VFARLLCDFKHNLHYSEAGRSMLGVHDAVHDKLMFQKIHGRRGLTGAGVMECIIIVRSYNTIALRARLLLVMSRGLQSRRRDHMRMFSSLADVANICEQKLRPDVLEHLRHALDKVSSSLWIMPYKTSTPE
jgi:hypothetical protein